MEEWYIQLVPMTAVAINDSVSIASSEDDAVIMYRFGPISFMQALFCVAVTMDMMPPELSAPIAMNVVMPTKRIIYSL